MRPSRQIISGEIVVSLFAIAYAWSGGISWPLDPGGLFTYIYAREGSTGNATWALMLGVPASLLIFAGLRELYAWGAWTERDLERSAMRRGRLVCAQGLAWMYALHLCLHSAPGAPGVRLPVLVAHALIGFVVCTWSYIENRRVRREIRYSNARLAHSAG